MLYRDSYSVGLEWESNFVRNIYRRMDLFCLSSSCTRCKLRTFERVLVVMNMCKNSAKSNCHIRRSVSLCSPGQAEKNHENPLAVKLVKQTMFYLSVCKLATCLALGLYIIKLRLFTWSVDYKSALTYINLPGLYGINLHKPPSLQSINRHIPTRLLWYSYTNLPGFYSMKLQHSIRAISYKVTQTYHVYRVERYTNLPTVCTVQRYTNLPSLCGLKPLQPYSVYGLNLQKSTQTLLCTSILTCTVYGAKLQKSTQPLLCKALPICTAYGVEVQKSIQS